MNHIFCVVYMVDGIHYRFRCSAKNKREARQECTKAMGARYKDIVEVINEDEEKEAIWL